jgi:hypothetical protein
VFLVGARSRFQAPKPAGKPVAGRIARPTRSAVELSLLVLRNNRCMNRIILVASAVALFALPSFAADISGTWTITGDVVGNAVNMKCAFTQDGTKVSGTCKGEAGSTPTTGSVTADKVTFTNTVQRDQAYELTYTATLDAAGTSMKGEIAVMGVTGTFNGIKDGASAPAASAESSAIRDVSGSWRIVGDVVGNAIDMKCALKADGPKLSGTCTYQGLGDAPTVGTVAGDKVTLQNSIQREQMYSLTYNGTLDPTAASMKGDIAVAGVTGTFSASRDK